MDQKSDKGGWKNVIRKERMIFAGDIWDIVKTKEGRNGGEVTPFFFTDIDSKWRANDLF